MSSSLSTEQLQSRYDQLCEEALAVEKTITELLSQLKTKWDVFNWLRKEIYDIDKELQSR